jgi:hypothetical protein
MDVSGTPILARVVARYRKLMLNFGRKKLLEIKAETGDRLPNCGAMAGDAWLFGSARLILESGCEKRWNF